MLEENLKAILDTKLWRSAEHLINFYTKNGYKIEQFKSIDEDYRYKPHLICKKKYEVILIELRERCSIEKPFENFVVGCQAKRLSVKVYYAIPEKIDEEDTLISVAHRGGIRKLGIGLLVVRDNDVTIDLNTISFSRRFILEAGSSLGKYEKKVHELIQKFNVGNCLDAIRDLSEEVEDATVVLALKAIRKGKINMSTSEIVNHDVDWSQIIDCLSFQKWDGNPQSQIITDKKLRSSLHSFRDVRNLSDHRKTAAQLRTLERQYPESMLQGIRLIRELVAINSRLK